MAAPLRTAFGKSVLDMEDVGDFSPKYVPDNLAAT